MSSARGPLYFAYGSNLCDLDRNRWCAERGLEDFVARSLGVAWLADYELTFDYASVVRGGGACNIGPRLGQVTPGVVFELSSSGLESLDIKEGVPRNYERFSWTALYSDGESAQVWTYRASPEARQQALIPPTAHYAGVVAAGLRAYGLRDAMLRDAAVGRACAFEVSSLFVYGTLMRGEVAHDKLRATGVSEPVEARCPGRLADLGRYPGLLLSSAAQQVTGELYTMLDPAACLRELDAYEGFLGYDRGGEYRRVLVSLATPSGRRLAWTYLFLAGAGAREVPGGDWRRLNPRRDQER